MISSGVGLAALSAIGFAISTSLQHHANSRLGTGIVTTLYRQPRWVIGQFVALTAFAAHAWALRVGLLIVIQPIIVAGIVLAIPARSALARRLPHIRELWTVGLTAVGLSAFVLAVHPSAAATPWSASNALAAVLIGAAAAAIASHCARREVGVARARWYGVASGILFGLTAGLVKLAATAIPTAATLPVIAATLVSAWPAWLVPIVGAAGIVLNQRAYRAGPLSASMPLLNIVDVLCAIAFGAAVLGEIPAHDFADLVWQAGGLALILIGLRRLAEHPVAEVTAHGAPDLIRAGAGR